MSHAAHFHRPDTIDSHLYVITPVFNPQRYRSRWKLYKHFEEEVLSRKEAHLVTIECAFGDREEVFLTEESPKHTVIHVRTNYEYWIKENLINLAISRLPSNWKYVAWIDGDIKFARPDWVGETIHLLQHYDAIQMFSEAVDLDPHYQIMRTHHGFMRSYLANKQVPELKKSSYYTGDDLKGGPKGPYWHPGFAWAAKRQTIDHLGGLIDFSILGGGDMYMAYALVGRLDKRQMPASLGASGVRWLREWQNRAEKHVRRNVGFMHGTILHYWHGKKVDRAYKDRGQVLVEAEFDPELDLKKDWQGLWQLTDRSLSLRDGIRAYFRQRNEDSIDL